MIKRICVLVGIVCVLGLGVYSSVVHRSFPHDMPFVTDTLADTASGDGRTNMKDTVDLFRPIEWNTLLLRAIIKNPLPTSAGMGASDSVYWRLIRKHWASTDTLKKDSSAAIPDTFFYIVSGANDTVMRGDWFLEITTSDTATKKPIVTATYKVNVEWEAIPIER